MEDCACVYPSLTWLSDIREVTLVDTGIWLEHPRCRPRIDRGDREAVLYLSWLQEAYHSSQCLDLVWALRGVAYQADAERALAHLQSGSAVRFLSGIATEVPEGQGEP